MTTTSAVGTTPSTGATSHAVKNATTLDINDFLKLMSTQLTNQDPLKPLDSTAFVAQLAQFGTVAGIQSMQDSLATLTDSLRSSQALSGAALVGHRISAPVTTASYGGDAPLDGAVQVPGGARAVELGIYDAAGQVVRRMALPETAGLQRFSWDGRGDDGAPLAAGRYGFKVVASVGGSNVSLQPQLSATVGSVTIAADGAGLVLNTRELGAVALGNVTQVF
ncbi:MAG: flagellar hook assembly protein FlgD [Chloroflexi bacterium]|nr:flagellar hook assembly protein FlgD [Chloroflexota bacterium]